MTSNNQPNHDDNASEESTTAAKKVAGQVRKSADTNFHVGESSKSQKRKTRKRGRKKKKKENDDVLDEMTNKLLRTDGENSRKDANKKKQKQTVETSRKGKEKVVYDDFDSDFDSDEDPNDDTCLLYEGNQDDTLSQLSASDKAKDFYDMGLYRRSTGRKSNLKSELDRYLNEDCEPDDKPLDILG
ncbi:uncharacterized protein LOC130933787 [Arachis stenosperma]|uniref:uncharacterized protein LOC130933787 n=1 Tax=Arachis stenosperma TaxID=217475 RepID=UPI0025ACDF33|nr:uncharacterized protein LOC130933787 [Arachis stenosperma]